VITVGVKGPGARARPSCSTTNHKLLEAVPGATEILRDVQPQPSQVGEILPGRGTLLVGGLELGATDLARLVLDRKSATVSASGAVVVGNAIDMAATLVKTEIRF